MGGEPPQPSPCAANIRGGSQTVTAARDSMPGPKFIFTATGFPSFSSNSVGTNQDEIPGPVAMACQTSSGVPGTSTSTWIERRPEASFFTLMLSPWDRISAAECSPRPPGDARAARAPACQKPGDTSRGAGACDLGKALFHRPAGDGRDGGGGDGGARLIPAPQQTSVGVLVPSSKATVSTAARKSHA